MKIISKFKKIVIKIGSSSIIDETTNKVKIKWLRTICKDIVALSNENKKVAFVSSGAVALGSKKISNKKTIRKLEEKQAAAAIGQIELANCWQQTLKKNQVNSAQLLLTLDDSEIRRRYLNVRKTISSLHKNKIIPIINENDTVATDEIKFGDNDRLSARVAEIIKADLLILLSDVSGLYDKDPKKNKKSKLIKEVQSINKSVMKAASFTNNQFAKGGMATKIMAAKIATSAGCGMVIVNGNSKKIIQKTFSEREGTYFHPKKRKKNN